MKILVIAPNWIGDAVMSLSLIQSIYADPELKGADGRPCEIHVIAPVVTAPVYRFSKAVATVQVEPFAHGKFQLLLRRSVGHALRSEGFERAYVLPNSLKAALLPWFAKIPWRSGYSGELRSLFLKPVLPKPSKLNKPPMLQWYGALGGYSESQLLHPVLSSSPSELQRVKTLFSLSDQYLGIAPGAEYGPAKRWPAGHVASVANAYLLANRYKQVVLLGGPKDREFADQIVNLIEPALQSRVLNLCGVTTLAEAFEVIAWSECLLTNDSGLMHVAAALNVKVHAVYGSSSPTHTPPLSDKASVYYLGLECSPCYERTCPLGHTDCLVKLKPQKVIAQMLNDQQKV